MCPPTPKKLTIFLIDPSDALRAGFESTGAKEDLKWMKEEGRMLDEIKRKGI